MILCARVSSGCKITYKQEEYFYCVCFFITSVTHCAKLGMLLSSFAVKCLLNLLFLIGRQKYILKDFVALSVFAGFVIVFAHCQECVEF